MTQTEAYFRNIEELMFPNWKSAAICLVIWYGRPDARICLELGFFLLLDKPVIVLVPVPGTELPENLKLLASEIVHGDPAAPQTRELLNNAVLYVLMNDPRVRQ